MCNKPKLTLQTLPAFLHIHQYVPVFASMRCELMRHKRYGQSIADLIWTDDLQMHGIFLTTTQTAFILLCILAPDGPGTNRSTYNLRRKSIQGGTRNAWAPNNDVFCSGTRDRASLWFVGGWTTSARCILTLGSVTKLQPTRRTGTWCEPWSISAIVIIPHQDSWNNGYALCESFARTGIIAYPYNRFEPTASATAVVPLKIQLLHHPKVMTNQEPLSSASAGACWQLDLPPMDGSAVVTIIHGSSWSSGIALIRNITVFIGL